MSDDAMGKATLLALGMPVEVEEAFREYTYPTGIVRIENVRKLTLRNDYHVLRTADGHKHTVVPGWIHLEICDESDSSTN